MSPSVQRILVLGGGVIGSVYASWLAQAGHQVTVLGRGQHLSDLRDQGLVTVDRGTSQRTTTRVATCDHLAPDDQYDLLIVAVRLEQVAEVLPIISANTVIPTVLFLLNNAFGARQFAEALGADRVVLGFPGIGGQRKSGTIEYYVLPQQPTTLGEVSGHITPRLRELAEVVQATGHPVTLTSQMDAWLKTHAVFMSCVTAAIDQARGDSVGLACNRRQVATMVRAIREGFAALRRQGTPVTPTNLAVLFGWMPSWFAVRYWQRALRGPIGTLAIGPHARAAREEMAAVAAQVLTLLQPASKDIPTLRQLLGQLVAAPGAQVPADTDVSA
jgi:2-dehydropantoate 2-reductase